MKRIIAIAFFALFLQPATAQQTNYSSMLPDMLKELDQAVEKKSTYRKRREAILDSLKNQARTSSGPQKAELYKRIFRSYAHVQTDSARTYLERIGELKWVDTDASLRAYLDIGHAEIQALSGQYSEAIEWLHKVVIPPADTNMKLHYYHKLRTIYGWMADYAVDSSSGKRWRQLMQTYRDSILQLEPAGPHRDIVVADDLLEKGHVEEALRLSLQNLDRASDELVSYNYYNLSQTYKRKSDADAYVYFLIKTAIADLKSGLSEYGALPELAQVLFERGDLTRAYDYLVCSIEDASYCKARLRAIESSNIFPIIEKAYKQQKKADTFRRTVFFYLLLVLVVILAGFIICLRRLMKQRAHAQRLLIETNNKLQDANDTLQDTNRKLTLANKMKEEYIARYLNRCRDYLDTLDEYRNQILRFVKKNREVEDLQKLLRSDVFINKERTSFYADFDEAFLKLFPDFIEKFNALLEPEAAFTSREKKMRLCTELRIFALIRLGVTESTKIAHFLNYSLATIYNYRSKVRNHARGDKAEFEKRVMEI